MDPINAGLLFWFVGSLLILGAIEAYTAVKGIPTISARVQKLGSRASIVVIWTSFVVGYLLAHFWDQWARF